MVRPTVVLPQPDSPPRPSVSPAAIENETSSTAFTVAVCDDRKLAPPALIVKYFCRWSTASRGCATASGAAACGAISHEALRATRGAEATSAPAAISSARQQAER